MTTTAIYVPVSLNRQFATQMHLLCRSLRRNACFPGEWKVIFTVSRDASIALDSPQMAWASRFPVEFRWVDETMWRQHGWVGTSHQQSMYNFDTDVVLYMDADTVAVGSLAELVEQSAAADEYAAWPAWQPPADVDIERLLSELGFPPQDYGLRYSGYGLSFLESHNCPPYFNAGFVAMSGRLANQMALTYPGDFESVSRMTPSNYRTQIALAVNLLRNGYRYRALDMRYNLSNGDFDVVNPFDDPVADAAFRSARESIDDARVLHYCVQSEEFQRKRDLDGIPALRAFCSGTTGHSGTQRLRRELSRLLGKNVELASP